MRGMDNNNGIIVIYSLARKRFKKYYKKTFLYLLDIISLNAYMLYKNNKINMYVSCSNILKKLLNYILIHTYI